jgi:M6 family metalloprotease-like protein
MKRTFSVLCAVFFVLTLFGARLMNKPVAITQPDGTILNVLASGDEFHNWLHDANNYTIIQNGNTGWYTYAVKSGDTVIAGPYIAGQSNPAALGLPVGVNISPEQMLEKRNQFYGAFANQRSGRAPHFGTINNLVVFIKFTDSPDFDQNINYYQDMFNVSTPGYNSMHNYFQAVSYNQLDIETHFYPAPNNTTVVCYVDSHPRGYYMPLTGVNTIGYDEADYTARQEREFTLLTDASNFVSSQIPATLDLDADDDGNIDNVCFIVQGTTTAWATLLWPHRWSIYNSTAFINGARVFDFNFQLESFLDGSGTSVLCHEMTHTLGSPDFYRYSDNTIDPIGDWDLMCGNNNPPQSMSNWIKYNYLDWVEEFTPITQSGTYTINSVWAAENNIYRIPSWRTNEYYVVEYRKPFGIYDSNLPGYGLLIYRLNTAANGNADGPPDELYIYRPNGTSNTVGGFITMANYSSQVGRTAINESTVPTGFLSDEMPGGLDISEITEAGGETMSFRVIISNVQVTFPKGGETFFSGTAQTITWKARSTTGNAKIEYSVDNGQSWQIIVASTPNDGSFIWSSVPVFDSSQCLIKVTTLAAGANDTCNNTFSIVSTVGAPTAIFPNDQMTNAPTNPTFSWHPVSGASAYVIQISTDSYYNQNIVNLIDWADTTYTYNNLTPFTTYYWHVAASAPVGISDFTPNRSFTTGQISILPAVPVLQSPANNATNQPMNAALSWNASDYGYFYHYQVATDNFFTHVVAEGDTINALRALLPTLLANTRYYWRVQAGNPAGYSYFTNMRSFTTGNYVTANEEETLPVIVNLKQNQPNPFSHNTQIEVNLKAAGAPARLTVYNLKGQTVKVLFNGISKAQTNRFDWNGTDTNGKQVSNGVYYYKLETTGLTETKKMLLIR